MPISAAVPGCQAAARRAGRRPPRSGALDTTGTAELPETPGADGRARALEARARRRLATRAGHTVHAPRERGEEAERDGQHDAVGDGPGPARRDLALALEQLLLGPEGPLEPRRSRDPPDRD